LIKGYLIVVEARGGSGDFLYEDSNLLVLPLREKTGNCFKQTFSALGKKRERSE